MPSHISNEFIAYKWRWFVLFVVSALNITNAAIWISFAPAVNDAMAFYNVSETSINWFSLVFFFGTLVFGILSIYMIDTFGLRKAILIGAWLNGLGAAVRAVGSSELVGGQNKFYVTLIGQILAALAQPFLIFIPTKVAEAWFPTDQRALATGIAAIANPVGQVLGCGLTPVIVKHYTDIKMLNIVWCIPSAACTLLATVGVTSSKPPSPPAASAAVCNYAKTSTQLKELVQNVPFLLLVLNVSCGVGLFGALISCMQEILCPHGYSDFISSLSSVLLVGCGLLGGVLASVWADKSKKFMEIAKIAVGLSLVFFCAFVIMSRYEYLKSFMLAACCATGVMGFASYPVSLELGIECTYPVVSEATSTGVLMIVGQLLGILYVVLLESLGQTPSPYDLKHQTCSESLNRIPYILHSQVVMQPQDRTVALLVMGGISIACCSIFILLFKTDYKRLQAEEKAEMGPSLAIESSQDVGDGSMQYNIYC